MSIENTTVNEGQAQATTAANVGITGTYANIGTAINAGMKAGLAAVTPETAPNYAMPATPAAEQKAEAFKIFNTQKDFDDVAAGIKHNAKEAAAKEAEKQLLAVLGLTPEEKDKLDSVRKAYENSFSAEEKANLTIQSLQTNCESLKAQTEEKDVTIQVLCKLSGKSVNEISDVVKMAKAITSESLPIDSAIEKVMAMFMPPKIEEPTIPEPTPIVSALPELPKGIALVQPNTQTLQGKLDPENMNEALHQYYKKA